MANVTPNRKKRIFKKYRGHCAYCGVALDKNEWHMDHLVPKSRGGSYHVDNMVPACPGCNMSKYTRTPDEFRDWILPRMVELLSGIHEEFLRHNRCLSPVQQDRIYQVFRYLYDQIGDAYVEFEMDRGND